MRILTRPPVAALVIALAAWLVYRPALNRVFAMDQVWYIAELDGRTSLADGLHFVDYAATRTYWKGDDALYRPLLFVWLAIGNRLFAYHHVAWNVANLVLHVTVAFCLYALLVAIRPSPIALPIAVLFAVLKPPLDLVTWNHLGGYLIGCACLALGCRAFVLLLRLPEDSRARGRRVFAFALAFTAAGFCHEAMVVAGVIAATTLVVVFRRRGTPLPLSRVAWLYAPAGLFAAAYAFHVTRVARLAYVDRPDVTSIFDAGNLLAVLPRSLGALAAWTREVALPSALTFTPAPFARLAKQFAFSWVDSFQLVNLAVAIALGLCLVFTTSRARLRQQAPFLGLAGLSLVAYAGIICLGRPQREVLEIAYYLYPFSLLLIPLAYACIDFDKPARRPFSTISPVYPVTLLMVFIALHGFATHEDAHAIGRANDAASAYLSSIEHVVDAHAAEPGFRLELPEQSPAVDPDITLRAGYPDDAQATVRTVKLTRILFARYCR